jgi:hypothetical protein
MTEPGALAKDPTRQDALIEHIWTRHQFAVMARSRDLNRRISAMVTSDPPRVAEALELIAEALAATPSRNGWHDALEHAWSHMAQVAPSGLNRDGFLSACKQGREEARRYLFHAATSTGDEVLVGSSLLDDNPLPGFAFYKKGNDWWQVREKNGRLSCLPLTGLLSRATSSARRDLVLQGEGILRRVGGSLHPDPRFVQTLRRKGLWSETWVEVRGH